MVSRLQGLEKITLDGSEYISPVKFSLLVTILKKRIEDEQHNYKLSEQKLAQDLIALVKCMEVLCRPQNTPIYTTNIDPYTQLMVTHLMTNGRLPLPREALPVPFLRTFDQLTADIKEGKELRNQRLSDYINMEKVLRSIDLNSRYDFSCLLGVSFKVRNCLDQLRLFNEHISDRFKLMTRESENNVYQVNYMLNQIEKLQEFHRNTFPKQHRKRKGNYTEIDDFYTSNMDPVQRVKFANLTPKILKELQH